MKKIFFYLMACTLFIACNPIPNKSVFEELTTDELASAIKSDPAFAEEYENIRTMINLVNYSEVQKAQYKDVTYRRLCKYARRENDTAYWAPRKAKWGQEWDETFAADLAKVDEKVAYWEDYKAKNSLSRFVTVELSDFFITHYSYIGGVQDAYICFNLTPTDGTIEQVKFTYSYSFKIDNGRGKTTKSCIYTSPISKKTEGSWEIDYLDREKFDGMTVAKFNQKYDLNIEVTDVRKDGVNYSLDDLNIPEAIQKFWLVDSPETRDAVAVLVNPSYVNRNTYIVNKQNEEMKDFDALCYEFVNVSLEENILNSLKSIFD